MFVYQVPSVFKNIFQEDRKHTVNLKKIQDTLIQFGFNFIKQFYRRMMEQ